MRMSRLEPAAGRHRHDPGDRLALAPTGRACSNTSCPCPAPRPRWVPARMPRVSGDRGTGRGPSPARAGRRRAGLPGLWGRLGPWGHARPRPVRHAGGRRSWARPRRARCGGCGATHVLLAAAVLLRRADRVESVGAALLADRRRRGTGRSPPHWACRPTRGWLRRARQRAGWLPRALAMREPWRPTRCSGRSCRAARGWRMRSRRWGWRWRRSPAGWGCWRTRRGR